MEKRCSKQTNYAALGSFQGKESCEALANIIVPHLDEGIGKINGLYCVILENKDDTGSDFVLMPRTLCSNNQDRNHLLTILRPRDEEVWILRYDDPETEAFRFNRTDLPDT